MILVDVAPDALGPAIARQLRRRLDALREETEEALADAMCAFLQDPGEEWIGLLFGRLHALFEQVLVAAGEAVRSRLAELAAEALATPCAGKAREAPQTHPEPLLAPTPESTPEGTLDAVVENGGPNRLEACVEACNGQSGEGSNPALGCPPGESRLCGVCRAPFRVNRRHAKRHAYCSAPCRSKARHRRNKARSEESAPGDAKGQEATAPVHAPDAVTPGV